MKSLPKENNIKSTAADTQHLIHIGIPLTRLGRRTPPNS